MLKTVHIEAPAHNGLFSVQMDIGVNQPGAPVLHISLCVCPDTRQLTGTGQILANAHPHSLGISYLKGYYFATPVTADVEFPNVLIIMGVPYLAPRFSSAVPQPNMEIFLELDNAWKSGFCTYKYESDGAWYTVASVPAGFMEPRMLASVV